MADNTNRVAVSAESLACLELELMRAGFMTTDQAASPTYLQAEEATGTNTSTQGIMDPGRAATPTIGGVENAGRNGRSAREYHAEQQSDRDARRDGPGAVAGCRYCRRREARLTPSNVLMVLEIMSLDQIAKEIAEERAQIVSYMEKITGIMDRLRVYERVVRQGVEANRL